MGCTCNEKGIFFEKFNEMKENDNLYSLQEGNEKKDNGIKIYEGNKSEKYDYLNEKNKLRNSSFQTGLFNIENLSLAILEKNNNDNQLIEIQTDKITENDFNELIAKYPEINDDVRVEKRNPQEFINNKVIYYGEWKKNKNIRHGRGIQLWPEGAKYIGNWKNDKACGKGKLIHSDGDIYEGEWFNDKPNGFGIYIHLDGTKYEGEWKDDKQNGNGKETWSDGSQYEGQYKNGIKSGYGKFCWSDGAIYEGHFENNKINGEGTYIFPDKRKYIGSWADNKLEGNGLFIWPDGRKYEGEYKNDKKEGFGSFYWSDGKIYKGYWKNGKQNGEGEFYDPGDNVWKKGHWYGGKKVKWY